MNLSKTAAAVAILALCSMPVASAFVLPGGGGTRIPFVGGSSNGGISNRHVVSSVANKESPSALMLFGSIKNFFTGLKKKSDDKADEIKAKAKELVKKGDQALDEFGDYLAEAAKNKSIAMTQEVAVEVVKMLNGDWDLAIACNRSETSEMMEGAVDNVTDDLITMGLASNASETKDAVKRSRLEWKTTWDASTYPLGVQNDIYVGSQRLIQFFGTFQFDIVEHNAVFALDELIVFGVKVDLTSVIEEAKALEEMEEDEDETETEDEEAVEVVLDAETD